MVGTWSRAELGQGLGVDGARVGDGSRMGLGLGGWYGLE